jgi:excisionase family DNA binding protein
LNVEPGTSLNDLRTLTVEEAAELLGVRAEAVRLFVREGRLEAFKVGRRLRMRPAAVQQFLESCRVRPPVPVAADRGKRRPRGRLRA